MTQRPAHPWRPARAATQPRSVKQEMRENLMRTLAAGEPLFPGIVGYEDTVVPAIVNALLARQNFILLGLRGQAKSRILRAAGGAARRGDPGARRERGERRSVRAHLALRQAAVRSTATTTPIEWVAARPALRGEARHPRRDVADLIGDIDPIRAARGGHLLSRRAHDPLRADAAREPRDLRHQRAARPRRQGAGRALQHHAGGRRPDQRLPGAAAAGRDDGLQREPRGLHGARQDHHPAQGPHRRARSRRTTRAPSRRGWRSPRRRRGLAARRRCRCEVPDFIAELVERIAFLAREDKRIDRRSG